MSTYSIPKHRRGFWFSLFWWVDAYGREEDGFVIEKGKKIPAKYRLCGFFNVRWWELIKPG